MTTSLSEQIIAVDECILDCLQHSNCAHGVVVPVREVADAVMLTTCSNMDEYQQILRLVRQRSIQKGYAMAFYRVPTNAEALPEAELFSSR